MSELLQTGGDFRGIQDVNDLIADFVQQGKHWSPVVQSYIETRTEFHLHIGVASGPDADETAYYCARFCFWDNFGLTEASKETIGELPGVVYLSKCRDNRLYDLVLVGVREVGEGHERLISGLPSLVCVTAIDEVDYFGCNSGQSSLLSRAEASSRSVNGKLDIPGLRRLRSGAMPDELPGNVVKYAPVVVDGVTEPGGERVRQVGITSLNDQIESELAAKRDSAGVSVWFTTDGWLWMSLEEPEHFTLRGCHMEVRPLELDPGAAKRITHGGDND
jgi:hypothetical protein